MFEMHIFTKAITALLSSSRDNSAKVVHYAHITDALFCYLHCWQMMYRVCLIFCHKETF